MSTWVAVVIVLLLVIAIAFAVYFYVRVRQLKDDLEMWIVASDQEVDRLKAKLADVNARVLDQYRKQADEAELTAIELKRRVEEAMLSKAPGLKGGSPVAALELRDKLLIDVVEYARQARLAAASAMSESAIAATGTDNEGTVYDRNPSQTVYDRNPSQTVYDRNPSQTGYDRNPSQTGYDRKPSVKGKVD